MPRALSGAAANVNRCFPALQSSLGRVWPTQLNSIGSLITRIGFWAHYTITLVWSPPNSLGNYLGPYTMKALRCFALHA